MCAWALTAAIRGTRARLVTAEEPRARAGRAPDVFRRGGWVPMRCHRDEEEVDFAIVGTGAGGGTLAAKLAEAGFSVIALDAGPTTALPAARTRSSSAATIRGGASAARLSISA